MDVRNWPMDKIMQLPDWCFGRRYPVSCEVSLTANTTGWDIAEVSFPEKMVIWEGRFEASCESCAGQYLRLGLGFTLPTTQAEMTGLDQLFKGFGQFFMGMRLLNIPPNMNWHMSRLRLPVMANARKLILEVTTGGTDAEQVRATVIVSTMPTEVPDWLALGQA